MMLEIKTKGKETKLYRMKVIVGAIKEANSLAESIKNFLTYLGKEAVNIEFDSNDFIELTKLVAKK